MTKERIYTTLLAITAFTLSFSALAHVGATGIIKERMELYSRNKDNIKAIRIHLQNSEFGAIVPLAEQIRDWAAKMPAYFPAGSDGKPSEAAPKIWTDFVGFKEAASAHYQAADKLVSAAKSKNLSDTTTAFKATAATCKSCHQSYRLD